MKGIPLGTEHMLPVYSCHTVQCSPVPYGHSMFTVRSVYFRTSPATTKSHRSVAVRQGQLHIMDLSLSFHSCSCTLVHIFRVLLIYHRFLPFRLLACSSGPPPPVLRYPTVKRLSDSYWLIFENEKRNSAKNVGGRKLKISFRSSLHFTKSTKTREF
jgi:hypothetical protein